MCRPKGCIYPNCLNCPLPECEYDGIEVNDEVESREIDFAIIHSRTIENHFVKGTYSRYASQRKYFTSHKGKMTQKRYRDSDKGRAASKRKDKKDIASGKNAERCKRYYEKHKAEILAKAKAKREKKVGDTKWQVMLNG